MALRAIPNLWYVRPADANETAMAWRIALEREGGPGGARALAGRRCRRSTAPRSRRPRARCAARTRSGSRANGEPDVILIATGSEVWVALEAARTRWTRTSASSRCRAGSSSPSSPQEYREEVLPADVRARLSVEAGITLGWKQWVGDRGDSVAIDRFGASAPGDEVLEKLGFTPENVAARAARCSSGWPDAGRGRVRPPRRQAARARARGARRRRARALSTSAPTRTPSGSTIRTRRASSARRFTDGGPSAASSSAAPASARRSRPARSPGSGPRSATTPTPPTRASSTTT